RSMPVEIAATRVIARSSSMSVTPRWLRVRSLTRLRAEAVAVLCRIIGHPVSAHRGEILRGQKTGTVAHRSTRFRAARYRWPTEAGPIRARFRRPRQSQSSLYARRRFVREAIRLGAGFCAELSDPPEARPSFAWRAVSRDRIVRALRHCASKS